MLNLNFVFLVMVDHLSNLVICFISFVRVRLLKRHSVTNLNAVVYMALGTILCEVGPGLGTEERAKAAYAHDESK